VLSLDKATGATVLEPVTVRADDRTPYGRVNAIRNALRAQSRPR
jgi:hypothetical protein